MKKIDIVEAVREKSGYTRIDAALAVEAFINCILNSCSKGHEVNLVGIGKFIVKKMKARDARNPKTGEKCIVPAHNKVSYKSSIVLRDALNTNGGNK